MLAKVPTDLVRWRLPVPVTLVSSLPRIVAAAVAGVTLAACGSATQVGTTPDGGSTVSPSDTGPAESGPSESGPSDTGPSETGPSDGGPSQTAPADSPTSPSPSDPGSLSPKQLAGVATEDLSARTGLLASQITVTRNDAVTWPDGSLGCPEPGMAYITMLSPGRLIVLEAGGKTYEYHAGDRVAPFLCENPQPPIPAG